MIKVEILEEFLIDWVLNSLRLKIYKGVTMMGVHLVEESILRSQ